MKSAFSTALMILLLGSSSIFAADDVRNKGQAFAACKAAAFEKLENVQGVKMLSVRLHKKQYKLKLRINSGEGRSKVICRVARNGDVEFGDQ